MEPDENTGGGTPPGNNDAPAGAPPVVRTAVPNQADGTAILRLAAAAGLPADTALEMVTRGLSVEAAAGEIVSRQRGAIVSHPAAPTPGASADMGEDETPRYSLLRAMNAAVTGNWQRAGLEREVSGRIAQRMNKELSGQLGFFMPTRLPVQRTTLLAGTTNKGKELIDSELRVADFIDFMRAKSRLFGTGPDKLGGRLLTGLTGNQLIPRQSGTGSVQWVGENPGSDFTEDSASLDQVPLTPKMMVYATRLSRQMIAQSSIDSEDFVRSDLYAGFALAFDRVGLVGGGSNEPVGILGTATGTAINQVQLVVFGTNGGAWSLAKAQEFIKKVRTAEGLDGALAWVHTVNSEFDLRNRQRIAGTSDRTIWRENDNTVEGYRAVSDSKLPTTLTKGTASGTCHAAIFGDFDQVIGGEWGAAEIIVDPFSLSMRGLVRIVANQFGDIGIRLGQKFAVTKDVVPV